MPLPPRSKGDDEELGSFEDPFHLEAQKFLTPLAQGPGRRLALFLDQAMDRLPQSTVGDAKKTPRLHVAHAGGLMRRPQ